MNIETTKDQLINGDVFYELNDPNRYIWELMDEKAYGMAIDWAIPLVNFDKEVIVVFNRYGERKDNQAVAPGVKITDTQSNYYEPSDRQSQTYHPSWWEDQ
jgi:hypothetical protein